ncbi:MAG: FAD-linked oxidase [Deltaproteobacteria bacterium GWA2_45_12]|nr:MAG: FAD-linked oxidase [Deltaproteobacteria bacterium GWA2_45_12]
MSVSWQNELPPLASLPFPVLPHAYGRSYGDSCLNENGILLDTTPLSHFLEFDQWYAPQGKPWTQDPSKAEGLTQQGSSPKPTSVGDKTRGLLRCEAGTSLAEILDLVVPHGYFLPVTPGTKFVSVGGAIANDVHGKNHHRAGTFGSHVLQFELLRSNGERLLCSPNQNEDFFKATIGGLGLTGLILWAEIKLKRIENTLIDEEIISFSTLDDFFELSLASDLTHEYTVAWIDCLASGKKLGRGIFFRGNHAVGEQVRTQVRAIHELPLRLPLRLPLPNMPSLLLNHFTLKAMNSVWYSLKKKQQGVHTVPYDSFFYPLDRLHHWNRLYGKKGFLQYQCVIPFGDHQNTIKKMLAQIAQTGLGSFLSVLKIFGDKPSPGILSFPRPGVTLALDFPIHGQKIFKLLDGLDILVIQAGGKVYPAKDARMSAKNFQDFYPQWKEFSNFIDPKFSSSFWRRVTK